MVDVGTKSPLKRTAIARGRLRVGTEVLDLIGDGRMGKGDVVGVSRVAGIMGAKLTAQLIPMCHQISLEHIEIDIEADRESESLIVSASVGAFHKTGVEMECLTAVTVSLLSLYDMCKSVNKSMIIEEVKLVSKVKEPPVCN